MRQTPDLDRYRLSFDSVAEAYERSRPEYAPDALAWIAHRLRLGRVLDLGAGTGKLTRQLVALGADIVAIEPGDEMRAVLATAVPGVDFRAGSAEAIPLEDASVDAITIGQAFHWFRVDEALPEMHRVLRPGGSFALLWNEWDEDDTLMLALNEVVNTLRRQGTHGGRHYEELEATPLFGGREERSFHHADELEADVAVERISSVSALAAAEPRDRERALDEVRKLVGAGTVRFPMITKVYVADRV
ncbi:MAG: class I SAM-dependent methyltransferase [Actinomycetota bacterium]